MTNNGSPQVTRRDDVSQVIIPTGMTPDEAIHAIMVQRAEENKGEQYTNLHERIPAFPFEGAYAFYKAMNQLFGFTIQKENRRGDRNQIVIETGPNGESVIVPWGSFELPFVEGEVETDVSIEDDMYIFQISAKFKAKYLEKVQELIALTRKLLASESIYRGKAFEIKFLDRWGHRDPMPTPRFIRVKEDAVAIFNPEIETKIEKSLLSIIRYTDAVRQSGEAVRRNVLFTGPYGTGKSLEAMKLAEEAIKHGWTFLVIRDVHELPIARRFAVQYQPCIIFAEDIDRAAGEERTDDVNDVINSQDGIDTKSDEVITIFTTNHPEKINPAMIRPGRIDVVVDFTPPNGDTVAKMLRAYAGDLLPPDEDLTAVQELLSGEIAARVEEVLRRARLSAINKNKGKLNFHLTAEDLLEHAQDMLKEKDLFKKGSTPDADFVRGQALGRGLAKGLTELATNGHH